MNVEYFTYKWLNFVERRTFDPICFTLKLPRPKDDDNNKKDAYNSFYLQR